MVQGRSLVCRLNEKQTVYKPLALKVFENREDAQSEVETSKILCSVGIDTNPEQIKSLDKKGILLLF